MEDALTKIRILMECNNELRIIKTLTDMKTLLALKYSIKQTANTDELENIDPKNLACEEYKIIKLDSDRNYVAQTIIATYIDLCFNRSYVALEKSIKNILEHDEYRAALEEEEAKNKNLRRELNKQLRQQRNHIKAAVYESNMIIEKLKAQVEDSVLFTECRSRYTDKWQVARTEQHIQTIEETEVVSTEVLEYYKLRTDHEQRVHAEMELLINIILNETLERIEDWMRKYDEDMEKVDLKIRVKRTDFQNMRDKRLGLEKTFEDHDKVMKDWCTFKEIREQQRLYREKMNKSAIMVQAWWRGLLVRRKLGPFRVGKRGRKKKK
ncbi:hypothetical protein O3G_MSEX011766 [Manduca sexta]|nr:hypothetical protein O3G_MSEX011766 [Manduca sexta]